MLNLDQSIADWRRQMAAGGIKSHRVLDELESHLRDDIEEQTRSGLDAPQAFKAAIQRIGRAGELKAEFAKVGRTKKARPLAPGKAVIFTGALGLICLAFGFFRYWITFKIAIAVASTIPGTSDFYASANRSLTLSMWILCLGAALLIVSTISHSMGRRRKPPALRQAPRSS